MLTEKSIIQEIADLQNLSTLVDTYKIIAVSTMQRIRRSVLENRAFHTGLNSIFRQVKRAYLRTLEREARGKQIDEKQTSFLRRNRKTILLCLTSNTGLYGELINKVFDFFLGAWKKFQADAGIVGRIGKLLFEQAAPHTPFRYYDFADTRIDIEGLKKITRELATYERVIVCYGQFRSLFQQEPTSTEISGLAIGLEEAATEEKEEKEATYIFEPSLEKVAAFFESEIFASLLEQVFHESRLAKVASRTILLDSAAVNIDKALERMALSRQRIRHRAMNRRQLNAMSGLAFWSLPQQTRMVI